MVCSLSAPCPDEYVVASPEKAGTGLVFSSSTTMLFMLRPSRSLTSTGSLGPAREGFLGLGRDSTDFNRLTGLFFRDIHS